MSEAEQDKDQKTEQPTEKRKADLRREGRVAQSHDVVSAATLTAACATLGLTAHHLAGAFQAFTVRALRLTDAARPTEALSATFDVLFATLPALGAAAVFAIAAGLTQTGGLFSLELVAPKLERLDPTNNIKRILPSKDMLLETLKSMLKIAAIGVVIVKVVDGALPRLLMLGAEDPRVAAGEAAHVALRAVLWGGGAFFILAALDFALARYRFNRDAMMTRQEVKEEIKHEEQDPHLKARMRRRARELMSARSAGSVADASVLVVNPTHVAVALRYDAERDAAPVVVGKARDEAALRMRAEARKRAIPIVENRPLARALHKTSKVGRPIPVELYRAVAEIIAHVMRLRAGVRT